MRREARFGLYIIIIYIRPDWGSTVGRISHFSLIQTNRHIRFDIGASRLRQRLYQLSCAFSVILALSNCGGSGQPKEANISSVEGRTVDILSLKPGMNYADARDIIEKYAKQNGRYFEHSFIGPIGDRSYIGLSGMLSDPPDHLSQRETLVVIFSSYSANNDILGIQRTFNFKEGTRPKIDELQSALTNKFGKPTEEPFSAYEDHYEGHYTRYVWRFAGQSDRATKICDAADLRENLYGLINPQTIDPQHIEREWVGDVKMRREKAPIVRKEYKSFYTSAFNRENCGLVAFALIRDADITSGLAGSMDVLLVDFKRAADAATTERDREAEEEKRLKNLREQQNKSSPPKL